jgi:hypothetical protein
MRQLRFLVAGKPDALTESRIVEVRETAAAC